MYKCKLRGIMAENGYTAKTTAEQIGISRKSFGLKLNGKREFKQSELIKIANLFNKTIDEIIG